MSTIPACALFGQGADALLHIIRNPKGCRYRISCAFFLDRDSPEIQFLRKIDIPLIILHWKTWSPYFVFRGMPECQRLQEFYTMIQRTIFSQFSAQTILCDKWPLPITDPLFSTYPSGIFSLHFLPGYSDYLEMIPLLRPGQHTDQTPHLPIILPAATDERPQATTANPAGTTTGRYLLEASNPLHETEKLPAVY